MDFLKINTTSSETIEQSFKAIADTLLKDFKIKVNNQFYRLLDIEFYYSHEGKLVDPYIHGNDLQKETGRWYFHGSGIDITFGDDGNYGGILIRGIGKLAKDGKEGIIEEEIHGPVNVMKELTSNFHAVMDVSPNEFCLVKMNIEQKSELPTMFIISSNRIGLETHSTDKDGLFKLKPYRFIAAFHENGKNKFKDKEKVVKAAVESCALKEEDAIKILGYKANFSK